MSKILKVQNLSKTYKSGDHDLNVLNNVSFEVDKGQSFAIVGPSGSGKTTLLGLCAGLDTTDQGEVWLCGSNLFDLDEDGRALLRNQNVGFVFQDFQLLPTLTALENVVVPLELRGVKKAKEQGKELLAKVGLQEREGHYPSQLSGGEQQRVALARAFANRPSILFADEPTGNLDDDTGTRIEDLLFELNKEQGTALVIVTHDLELAKKTDKSIRLRSGKIEETVG
ncbi:MAG: ABC transporter ATP-binding protein [Muricauda sp.]|jgi:putative ABC transport system ATP-binding protein|uniref:ABC transporter ATP-binding protein n=1 Tax=Allomuricauda sp. ARW1Y1 TaxID=2663843 RepID=UPI0015CC6085|nr:MULTISPECIES: ABC transporter ATP-binding protein [unclassified Allomuricauda]MBO6590366.1 ABC transporter ATP-binding protein [Allomuricauda sp.]MBO6619993.1 ABC transporter ATP-binding protein [Allomuricauda sp.]MBO6645887.1 ABC transporter ATP-binding protein [Allomuricauda sp.]MBO6748331.1 ABC transporter ATP-binding protein [Allomuricauda sp.]MBO6845193.1 ABC transporter ATP-binding protein [Allomuricauda sp.]